MRSEVDRKWVENFFAFAPTNLRAPLTGEKVYTDGAVEKFEGVFIKRTVLNSPTDEGVSSFGLGIVGRQIVIGGLTLDKLFYQLKE